MLGTVKKYNHSADGQAPYRGCRRGTTRKVGKRMPPLLPSQVRRQRVEKERGWGPLEKQESPFLAPLNLCISSDPLGPTKKKKHIWAESVGTEELCCPLHLEVMSIGRSPDLSLGLLTVQVHFRERERATCMG